jgi:glycosyltransferase involved in cell wall biosynthesis
VSAPRIGLVIWRLTRGGTERQLYLLATQLDRALFEPVVFCLVGPLDPYGPRLEAAGVRVVPVRGGTHRLLRILRLASCLRRERVDLVHSQGFPTNAYALTAGRLAGNRAVLLSIRTLAPHPRWLRLAARWTNALADGVMVNSVEAQRYVTEALGTSPASVCVVPTAVETTRGPLSSSGQLLEARLEIAGDAPLVLAVARLVRQKRIDRFLETAALAGRIRPEIRFLVVGDGPLRDELERMAVALGLGSRVRFAGEQDAVPQLLRRASLLLLTSDYEGLPNVALEALAAARPVIATPGAGCGELLRASGGGWVSRTDSPDELASLVVRMLEDPADAAARGRQGQAYVARRHTVERMIRGVSELYERLLTGHA